MKKLIVNADDLGLAENVDLGIIKAHKDGVVTSATLIACGSSAGHASALALDHPGLGVGVHLCLTRERPVLDPARLKSITSCGRFFSGPGPLMARLYFGMADKREIHAELTAQVEHAIFLGIRPTHLDGHQHIHVLPGIMHITVMLAKQFDIPAVRYPVGPAIGRHGLLTGMEKFMLERMARSPGRYVERMGLKHPDRFYGLAETGRLDTVTVEEILRTLPDGTSELMCHPGLPDEKLAASTGWGHSWKGELDAVTASGLRELAQRSGVQLVSYRGL